MINVTNGKNITIVDAGGDNDINVEAEGSSFVDIKTGDGVEDIFTTGADVEVRTGDGQKFIDVNYN